MRIKSVSVRNFRCIRDAELHCGDLTVLVGRNGAGKSAFLRALEIFYDPAADYTEEDFYNRNTDEPICITVTYSDLTGAELELFRSHLTRGGELVVEKRMTWPRNRTSQKYYGATWQHPGFRAVRQARAYRDKVQAYATLRQQERYAELPNLGGRPRSELIEQALLEWERQHPDQLELMPDEGQFFGFREVGEARLERYTRFILVPAVLDAADAATDRAGSLMHELMALVVEQTLKRREDFANLQEEVRQQYEQIIENAREEDLRELRDRLEKSLQYFAPNARADIEWQAGELTLPPPAARVQLGEDEFWSEVGRVGHGLQRAFICALLSLLTTTQHSATVATERAENTEDETEMQETGAEVAQEAIIPALILAIEEPELYQHPTRQRYIANQLRRLAEEGLPGTASAVQVIYTTHSPLFVDVRRFACVRIVRKVEAAEPDHPPVTSVAQAKLDDVGRAWCEAYGRGPEEVTEESAYAHVSTLVDPWMNEGFFADVVVLVEGPSDRAALLAVARQGNLDLDARGIAIIPCGGKGNLIKAGAIFRHLGITAYLIWDADAHESGQRASHERDNKALLRFVSDENPDDCFRAIVESHYACFEKDLEATLRGEIGEALYQLLREECRSEFGCHDDDHYKRPPMVEFIVARAYESGARLPTLERMVERIVSLSGGEGSPSEA